MTSRSFDAIVVGGGSGGLSFAKAASRRGARVAMIEKAELGGTCVNRGCVPKKLMWDAARTLLDARRMSEMGLCQVPRFDLARLRDLSDSKINGLHQTFERQLSDAGVTLIRGAASIDGPDRIEVNGEELSTGRLVLATGAQPVRPDVPGADLAAVSDDVFGWRELPETLVILGGGYVGCEFAAIFAAFGTRVVLIEPSDRLLENFAEGLADHAVRALEAEGVKVCIGVEPQKIARLGEGFETTCSDGTSHRSARVLLATGRAPDLSRLGPISNRLETAESGALAVGDHFATSCDGVHAIGDAADRLPLTPVATRDGETLAEQLFGDWRDPIDLNLVATTAFLFPPHAQVGQPDGGEVTRSDPLRGEVTISGETAADLDFFTLACDKDAVCGAALAFDGAEEAIAAIGALIAAGGTRADLTATTGIHPTPIEEVLGR